MSNSEPTLRDEDKKIKIDSTATLNVTNDKNDLKGCYFYPTENAGVYIFCKKNDEDLATNITSGGSFSFALYDLNWTIGSDDPDDFQIGDTSASGKWSNNATSQVDEESGTFTAQASGLRGHKVSGVSATA